MAKKKVTEDMLNSFKDLREVHNKSFSKIGNTFDVSASTVKKNLDEHYQEIQLNKQQQEIEKLKSQLDKKTGAEEFLTEMKNTFTNRDKNKTIDYNDN